MAEIYQGDVEEDLLIYRSSMFFFFLQFFIWFAVQLGISWGVELFTVCVFYVTLFFLQICFTASIYLKRKGLEDLFSTEYIVFLYQVWFVSDCLP
jgi:hypothetical protein